MKLTQEQVDYYNNLMSDWIAKTGTETISWVINTDGVATMTIRHDGAPDKVYEAVYEMMEDIDAKLANVEYFD